MQAAFIGSPGGHSDACAHAAADKAMVKAGQQLHQLRYLLLEVALTPESTPAWRRLLVRVAEALLDGSTPPAAVPLLAALLQRGLARQGGEDEEGATGGISKQDEVRVGPFGALFVAQLDRSTDDALGVCPDLWYLSTGQLSSCPLQLPLCLPVFHAGTPGADGSQGHAAATPRHASAAA